MHFKSRRLLLAARANAKWDELQLDQAQITSLGAQCINLEAYEQAKQRYRS